MLDHTAVISSTVRNWETAGVGIEPTNEMYSAVAAGSPLLVSAEY
jgi:hypothetical protein